LLRTGDVDGRHLLLTAPAEISRAQGQDLILKEGDRGRLAGKLSPMLYVVAIVATLAIHVDRQGDFRDRCTDLARRVGKATLVWMNS
jgi:hypothetical protein